MNVGICAANKAGYELVKFLAETTIPYRIAFVATHPKDPYAPQIRDLWDCIEYGSSSFLDLAKTADIGLLLWWPDIVKPPVLHAPRRGWVNLHPSLLPYCRGLHPYYWNIVEKVPFGVSIHMIDGGTDTGPILFQKELEVSITDTGETLYTRALNAMLDLFKENFVEIIFGTTKPKLQDSSKATFHLRREIFEHSRIDLEKSYKAGDLIDIIRARTFMNGDSAYFEKAGKRYRIKAVIEEVHS